MRFEQRPGIVLEPPDHRGSFGFPEDIPPGEGEALFHETLRSGFVAIHDLRRTDPRLGDHICMMIGATYDYADRNTGDYIRAQDERMRRLMGNPYVFCLYDNPDGSGPDTWSQPEVEFPVFPRAMQQMQIPTNVRGEPYVRLASLAFAPEILGTLQHLETYKALQRELTENLGNRVNLFTMLPVSRPSEIRLFEEWGYRVAHDTFLVDKILRIHKFMATRLVPSKEGVLISRPLKSPRQSLMLVRERFV